MDSDSFVGTKGCNKVVRKWAHTDSFQPGQWPSKSDLVPAQIKLFNSFKSSNHVHFVDTNFKILPSKTSYLLVRCSN